MDAALPNPDASLVALGRAVRALRIERLMSQEQLARKAGIHATYISRIEAGRRNISWEAMKRISQALEVPAWQLVQKIEEMEKQRED
jgi:transcriptional regulator with XRE-family HTH domain